MPCGKKKEEFLTDRRCLEMLTTKNCEWLLRPKFALSEMAENFSANSEVMQESLDEISFPDVMQHCEEVAELLSVFNTRDNKNKPDREHVLELIRRLITPDVRMEKMLKQAEKTGQAMYLMGIYHRVTQTLFSNLNIVAQKSQNADGLDAKMKKDPTVENFTEYLVNSVVGEQVQTTDLQSRRIS